MIEITKVWKKRDSRITPIDTLILAEDKDELELIRKQMERHKDCEILFSSRVIPPEVKTAIWADWQRDQETAAVLCERYGVSQDLVNTLLTEKTKQR